jgi:hypothetical protein
MASTSVHGVLPTPSFSRCFFMVAKSSTACQLPRRLDTNRRNAVTEEELAAADEEDAAAAVAGEAAAAAAEEEAEAGGTG